IEILIIATHFELSTLFFFQYFTIFTLILLGFTAFLLYKFLLSKEENIDPQQKEFMLNLIDTDVIMKNRKMFYINGIAILVIIFLFLILPQLYITAGIGSVILILINKKFTKKSMSDMLKNIDWEILFFLGSIYVTIGCLIEAGFADLFHQIPLTGLEPIFLYLLLFLIITGMSAAVANKPTTLIMLPIISSLIMEGISALPLYFIFIFGITLGGNMVPQGAISHVAMLEIAEKNGVKDLTYRRLFVVGILVTAVMIITSIGYLYLLLFFGY
ncbi:MAG: SLC13 family permease, partial [Promethearchaeia archaeon]